MNEDIGEIDAIIGQFLDFARGENEDKAPHDIDALLHELGEHYQRLNKDVRVKATGQERLSFARMAVRRAIANLVDNALRYAGEPIEIETLKAPGGVTVEVRDRGPGIPADRGRAHEASVHAPRRCARAAPAAPAWASRSSSGSRAPTAARSSSCRATGGGLVARLTLKPAQYAASRSR